MPRVAVSISEEQKEDLGHYAEELGLSLSATVKTLAWQQLRYLRWIKLGRPRRRKRKPEDRTPNTSSSCAMDIEIKKPDDGGR